MSQAGVVNVVSEPGVVDFLQGDTGGPVGPNGSNVIFLLGDGVNISTTGNPGTNTITISLVGTTAVWSKISSSQALVPDHGYICVSPGGALVLSLPAISSVGEIVEVVLKGATSWQITQAAGQSIELGNATTTVGIGGSLTSTSQGDSLRMVCMTANLTWVVLSGNGNPIVI